MYEIKRLLERLLKRQGAAWAEVEDEFGIPIDDDAISLAADYICHYLDPSKALEDEAYLQDCIYRWAEARRG